MRAPLLLPRRVAQNVAYFFFLCCDQHRDTKTKEEPLTVVASKFKESQKNPTIPDQLMKSNHLPLLSPSTHFFSVSKISFWFKNPRRSYLEHFFGPLNSSNTCVVTLNCLCLSPQTGFISLPRHASRLTDFLFFLFTYFFWSSSQSTLWLTSVKKCSRNKHDLLTYRRCVEEISYRRRPWPRSRTGRLLKAPGGLLSDCGGKYVVVRLFHPPCCCCCCGDNRKLVPVSSDRAEMWMSANPSQRARL